MLSNQAPMLLASKRATTLKLYIKLGLTRIIYLATGIIGGLFSSFGFVEGTAPPHTPKLCFATGKHCHQPA